MCTCARPYGRAGRCGFGGRGVTFFHSSKCTVSGGYARRPASAAQACNNGETLHLRWSGEQPPKHGEPLHAPDRAALVRWRPVEQRLICMYSAVCLRLLERISFFLCNLYRAQDANLNLSTVHSNADARRARAMAHGRRRVGLATLLRCSSSGRRTTASSASSRVYACMPPPPDFFSRSVAATDHRRCVRAACCIC
jgi:hypothetical protein